MKRVHLFIPVLLILFCFSCRGRTKRVGEYGHEIYSPVYSSGFSIYEAADSSSVVVVRNPWQGAEDISLELFLSNGGESAPKGFTGQTVQVPLRKVVCLSSSHIAFIDALGHTDAIAGVSGARYISNEAIKERFVEGDVRDVGYDTNLNYELLASMQPDIVFIYGVGGENTAVTSKLRELGITVAYIAEYLEEHPLGKAEWIVPFGEFFGCREQAREMFESIAGRYESLREEASSLDSRPKVMLNAPYRDVWFVPGDRSYMVRLISDAGGEYVLAGDDSSVSRPLSGESAYIAVGASDVWLNPNQARTIRELEAENPKFAGVRVVRDRRVYNCLKRSTPGGGSDFWESGTLRADRVLEDIMMVLHPQWNPGEETYYYMRLE